MPKLNKRRAEIKQYALKGSLASKRRFKSIHEIENRQHRDRKSWLDIGDTFTALVPTLINPTGKFRTYEEHRMALLATHASLKRHIHTSILSDNSPIGPITIPGVGLKLRLVIISI